MSCLFELGGHIEDVCGVAAMATEIVVESRSMGVG